MTERNADRPIAVGDLVQVVRPKPCCGSSRAIGQVFKVSDINRNGYIGPCQVCGQTLKEPHAQDPADGLWAELRRLKRIPPLDELESNDLCHPMKESA